MKPRRPSRTSTRSAGNRRCRCATPATSPNGCAPCSLCPIKLDRHRRLRQHGDLQPPRRPRANLSHRRRGRSRSKGRLDLVRLAGRKVAGREGGGRCRGGGQPGDRDSGDCVGMRSGEIPLRLGVTPGAVPASWTVARRTMIRSPSSRYLSSSLYSLWTSQMSTVRPFTSRSQTRTRPSFKPVSRSR